MKNTGQFKHGNKMAAVGRQRQVVRLMLPGLRDLAKDSAVSPNWRRKLRAAARKLETASAASLSDCMFAAASLLRELAADLDGGEGGDT